RAGPPMQRAGPFELVVISPPALLIVVAAVSSSILSRSSAILLGLLLGFPLTNAWPATTAFVRLLQARDIALSTSRKVAGHRISA
ncbi:MAG: hypothetical protein AAB433_15280, partial [Nitrospirota bacterium]